MTAGAVPSPGSVRRPLVELPQHLFTSNYSTNETIPIVWSVYDDLRKRQEIVTPKSVDDVSSERFEFVILAFRSVLRATSLTEARQFVQQWVSNKLREVTGPE
jgi:hypothetical protein